MAVGSNGGSTLRAAVMRCSAVVLSEGSVVLADSESEIEVCLKRVTPGDSTDDSIVRGRVVTHGYVRAAFRGIGSPGCLISRTSLCP